MIRNLGHTFAIFAGTTARINARQSFGWDVAMCLCLENMNYQPKPNGDGRSQQLT